MKLSKNFSLSEFLKSNVAKRHGISNSPEEHHIEQMKLLCENTLQPIRDGIGSIGINSGFRSKELNKALGGAHKIKDGVYVATSQHCKGQAADLKFRNKEGKVDNKVIWDYVIEEGVEFDQMINEFDFAWIHISYNPEGNRCQLLEAYKGSNGKTKYKKV
ncbi:MAG: putative peptidase M15 [Prokaryotic dsDNA virus sp.]|nr:MAG: putative peptidase M15 [Prokaryotic dsDNA virus sp.]|tara:strand:- start:4359 stop:4838 length:480 start_codon:yes stop_codon:yes gene_type:complete